MSRRVRLQTGAGRGTGQARGRSAPKCWTCGKRGHLAAECPRNKLPMTDELTERDFPRLVSAAERQMERNRRRLGVPRGAERAECGQETKSAPGDNGVAPE